MNSLLKKKTVLSASSIRLKVGNGSSSHSEQQPHHLHVCVLE